MRKLLTCVLFVALGVGVWLSWSLLTPLTPTGPTFVVVRPGYSTRTIAAELKNAGVIRSKQAFIVWHYFNRGRSLKAGEYLFDKAADIRDVHARLAKGDIYVHTVVIPEGFTMFDIANAIEQAGLGTHDQFLTLAQSDTALISDLDPQARSLEGYLFPDTYEFTRSQNLRDIVAEMVKRFRQQASAIGLTDDVHRVVTMASIVERETSVPAERPTVASVYYNRLQKKMALDADPSVVYAKLLDGTYDGGLHHGDTQIVSAYNTYRHVGLPPGPVANPGRSALEAAMHPAQSDFFYFVSDGNGHHRFAHSLEEHNHNVAALRRVVQKRSPNLNP